MVWVGHPNWYFRISKHSLPFLKTKHTSPAFFADEFPADESIDDYVLKPLYSFAGLGVDMEPTREKLAALEKPHEWILQKKVEYAEFVPTPDGPEIKSGNPDDVSLAGSGRDPMLVNNLVRMSQGKMMGVDFNKEKTWVGSSIALHQRGIKHIMKNENPWIEICPGIRRRTHAHGRTMYQMVAELAAGSRMPEHQHSQEQIVHILSGRMQLIVEGMPHELDTGDSFYLASNIPHGVETIEDTRVSSILSVRHGTITWRSTKRSGTRQKVKLLKLNGGKASPFNLLTLLTLSTFLLLARAAPSQRMFAPARSRIPSDRSQFSVQRGKRRVFRFHELVADLQIGIDPTRDVVETFRHHSALFAKPAIDFRRDTFFEMFDDHVKHAQ